MNRIILLTVTALLAVVCTTSPELKAQDRTEQVAMKSFGDAITPDGAITTEDLLKAMTTTDSLATKVQCEVITSCTKKGCWMDVMLKDGEVMKVRFKDYGFFVPTSGLEGKHAIMQGYAKKETTDVATLQHYAEDAGKSEEEIAKITEPETSLMFLANGVLIAE
ncbi:MAG: DUF4920 domain-containing protein [Flavobacteriales bacterium]|nr:DUF4920 domain-containing protein [Flavobacteriales bacterium]MBK6945889.1 DUF4920 domain-containing protein [Flavobacteriales bacterium]MBK7239176.1 DUF4920 domain-containing protein [Flavobacteriales bacterium]MBK7298559.1 DUF4920 domain-containing protein [Flavobacteriales bacterium]MBK9536720.1 DUF4920 domain-containing protein [Flavobacteriales bacterium]